MKAIIYSIASKPLNLLKMPKLKVKFKKIWRKDFLVLFVAFWLYQLIGANLALASEPQLEYPTLRLPGIFIDLTNLIRNNQVTLDIIARYIYYFLVMIAGIVAFISLAAGGIRVATGAALQDIQSAKEQMRMAFVGLLIILFSWLILVTIDPRLVVIPEFEPIASQPPPPPKIEPIFNDGIIFETNHPKFPKIAIPFGKIRVEDTARFQVGQTYLNLSGQKAGGFDCAFFGRNCPYRIEYLTIVNPMIEEGLLAPIPKYVYGVACFQDPGFRGVVRIFVDPNPLDGLAHRTLFTLDPSFQFPTGFIPSPACRSILVFRTPSTEYYQKWENVLADSRDKIVFYELPYPDREKIHPGLGKRVIVGECYLIGGPLADQENEENCKRHESILFGSVFGLGFDPSGNRGRVDLYLKTTIRDPDTGREIKSWWPSSMEIKPEGKYLVFLFNDAEYFCNDECRDEHWDMGLAYWFTSGVDNFEDTNDKRLYWLRQPINPRLGSVLSEVRPLPQKAIIFRVAEVF